MTRPFPLITAKMARTYARDCQRALDSIAAFNRELDRKFQEDTMAGKNWIAGAVKHPGGLHKSLGVPAGQKIPEKKIEAAAAKGGKVGRQARLAETLSHLRKG